MEESEKFKINKFSGKKSDYALWKDRFLAHCCMKDFDDVVLNDGLVPKDSETLDPAEKLKIKYRKDNKMAYGYLVNLISDPASINAVTGAKTEDLPRGCVRTAFLSLERLFDIRNEDVKQELQQKFNKSECISNDKNPDIWFSQLETWRLRLKLDYKVDITELDLINHIIYNLKAPIYETTLLIIKREHQKAKTKTKVEDLKDEIRQVYTTYKTTSKTKGNSSEVSMVAAAKAPSTPKKSGTKFKGDCRLCGIKGHKAADCYSNEKNKDKRPSWYKVESANVASTGNTRPKLSCTYCGKENHSVERCFKKEKDDKKADSENAAVVMVMTEATASSAVVGKTRATLNHNSFIADSGASSHMRFSQDGMTSLEPYVVEVKVGNAETIYSTNKGVFKGTVVQRDGTHSEIELRDVLLVPKLWTNLFSITKAIDNPNVGLGKTDDNLIKLLPKNRPPIIFDKVIPTGKSGGRLLAMDIVPDSEHCALSTCSPTYMHNILNHANDTVVKATAKKLNIKLIGPTLTCESCARSKARVKRFNKESKAPPAKHLGERIHFDLCTMKHKAYAGHKNWLLIQDEYTKFIWSKFLKLKSEVPTTMLDWTTGEEKKGSMIVKKYRCDNAPEHYVFQKLAKAQFKTNKTFQFTAPHTPEHNGRVERKYATLFGKVRAMLNEALLPPYLRNLLWARAASCASKVENIIVNKETDKSPHELVYGENPSWIKSLRTFGEIAILQIGGTPNKVKAKLDNRGVPAMFVDYSVDHASDVYVFMKLDNRQIVLSRNYTWLNKLYGEYKGIKQVQVTKDLYWDENKNEASNQQDTLEVEEDEDAVSVHNAEEEIEVITVDEEEEEEEIVEGGERRSTRVSGLQRELRNMRDEWNPNPEEFMEDGQTEMVEFFDDEQAEMAFMMIELDKFPKTFTEAMKRSDKHKWKEAFWLEFENIEDKEVWQLYEKKRLPAGRKIIGNRWVNVIKPDGRYRSRTVAKGFSQIPGKDHQENHAPVIHDTTLHMVLCFKLYYKLHKKQFDVETAFLYGELEEELYMEFPEGYEEYLFEKGARFESKRYCLLLKKALYGLVQAARQWWKKITEVLNSIGFVSSKADPCLFVKAGKGKEPPAFIVLYVDDGGIIGTPEVIDEVMKLLSKVFKIKDLGDMKTFVACDIIDDGNTIWLQQSKLINHLKESFMKEIESMKSYQTPAGPKTIVMRPIEGDPVISAEAQSKYRSGVGMLLYLIKHSRPDLANAIRELTKVLDGATQAHYKAMLRVIKYVIDTEFHGLKIQPHGNQPVEIVAYSDSEYGGDRDTRISVYGYKIYMNGALISWKSKSGKSVTLSSTEAEYFACSEAAKEVMFIKNVLETMGIEVKLPMIIKVDNTGAIYLANNYTAGQRTKHIDIRVHYVREYIHDGIIKIEFVRSENNDADILTKNTTEELFKFHSEKNVVKIPKLNNTK